MTARSTYEATNASAAVPTSAAAARVTSNISNAVTHQEAINAVGPNAGKILQNGVSVADDRTIRAANVTYQVAKQKAAMIEQVTIQNAKDVLRNSGDTAPA